MEEENVKTEIVVEEAVEQPTARQRLEAVLRENLPEDKQSEDIDQMALDLITERLEMNERIVGALADDPRAAQAFSDIVNGERKPGAAIVRYFGKSLMDAEEGSPEYEALMKSDEEFFNERDAAKRAREEQNASAVAFFDAFESYLEAQGLDKQKYMDAVYAEVIMPSLELKVDEKLFARLVKAVDYDKDVEDAFSAGEVKGRNTNIHEMRAKVDDGLPKGLSSQAVMVEQPKRKVNSLIAKALNA